MKEEALLNENIVFRRVADEGVVVDQERGEVLVVNETAVRILELVRESGSIDQAVESMAKEYDIAPDIVKKDIALILEQINGGLNDKASTVD